MTSEYIYKVFDFTDGKEPTSRIYPHYVMWNIELGGSVNQHSLSLVSELLIERFYTILYC